MFELLFGDFMKIYACIFFLLLSTHSFSKCKMTGIDIMKKQEKTQSSKSENEDQEIIIYIVAIGKRDDMKVYKEASLRYKNN